MDKTWKKKNSNPCKHTLEWGASVALNESPKGIIGFGAKPTTAIHKQDNTQTMAAVTQDFTHRITSTQTHSPAQNAPVHAPNGSSPAPLSERIQQIEDSVKKCETHEELRAYMSEFPWCALAETATQMVFSDGLSENPQAMIVGEAPGADEDIQGKPFVGKSGQLLDRIIASIGLSRQSNTYISNIVPWRPPGNRTPTDTEIQICSPLIWRHIELTKPQFLILAGATPIRALLGVQGPISRVRGKIHTVTTPYANISIPALPIYHPSYLLRSPGQKAKAWQDMLTLQSALSA